MARKSVKNEMQDAEILKNKEYILKNAEKNNEQDKAIKNESVVNDQQEAKIKANDDKNKDQDFDLAMVRLDIAKLTKSVKIMKGVGIAAFVFILLALGIIAL